MTLLNPFHFPQESHPWLVEQIRQGRHSEALQWCLFAQRQNIPVSESLKNSVERWVTQNLQTFLAGIAEDEIQKISLKTKASRLQKVIVSYDAKRIASAHSNHHIYLWDPVTGENVFRLHGHVDEILSLEFSPDSKTLLSRSRDGTARLWNVSTGHEIVCFELSGEMILEAFFAKHDLTQLMTLSDKTVQIWKEKQGRWNTSHLFKNAHESIVIAGFYSRGSLIVTTNRKGVTRLWSGGGSIPITLLGNPEEAILSVEFSPQSRYITVITNDQKIKIWETQYKKWLKPLQSQLHIGRFFALPNRLPGIYSVLYSPDQTYLLARADELIELWNLTTGELQNRLVAHSEYINSCEFSPDGSVFVTAGDDHTAKLWETRTGNLLQILNGHQNWIHFTQFSSEGSVLSTSSHDGTVRFWNGKTGEALGTLKNHLSGAYRTLFSPDGQYLVSEDGQGQLFLWKRFSAKTD